MRISIYGGGVGVRAPAFLHQKNQGYHRTNSIAVSNPEKLVFVATMGSVKKFSHPNFFKLSS